MDPDEQPMFDIEFPTGSTGRGEGQRAVRPAKKKVTPDTPQWKRMSGVARPKCMVCVARMQDGGKWAAPDPVVWERSHGHVQSYYCWNHGAEARHGDGLEGKPKGMAGK